MGGEVADAAVGTADRLNAQHVLAECASKECAETKLGELDLHEPDEVARCIGALLERDAFARVAGGQRFQTTRVVARVPQAGIDIEPLETLFFAT